MSCIDATRLRLAGWLESGEARAARAAIRAAGVSPDEARLWLHCVTEDPDSADRIVALVSSARERGEIATGSVAIERWLLVRQGLEVIDSREMAALGDGARRLTCETIAGLVEDAPWLRPEASRPPATRAPGAEASRPAAATALAASNVRFRELAKIVTGRRFCAGLFHWEVCGVRRSWMLRVPLRHWVRLARTLSSMGGFGPTMFLHLNPWRSAPHLEEPAISGSLAVLAESLERRADLRGLAAASWLRSPDTHRVSPRLAAVNAPVLENGGFVTTVGAAPEDCGVFEYSERRRRLYREGKFRPTVGLVLWPREAALRWWRAADTCGPT